MRGRRKIPNERVSNLACPLPPCRVCGEEAAGFHYGVNTCEACKGFFQRSLSRHHEYACLKSNNCDVRVNRRKSCPKCRYNQCLKAGMSKTAIKTGRYTYMKRTSDVLEVKQLMREGKISPNRKDLQKYLDPSCYITQFNAGISHGVDSEITCGSENEREVSLSEFENSEVSKSTSTSYEIENIEICQQNRQSADEHSGELMEYAYCDKRNDAPKAFHNNYCDGKNVDDLSSEKGAIYSQNKLIHRKIEFTTSKSKSDYDYDVMFNYNTFKPSTLFNTNHHSSLSPSRYTGSNTMSSKLVSQYDEVAWQHRELNQLTHSKTCVVKPYADTLPGSSLDIPKSLTDFEKPGQDGQDKELSEQADVSSEDRYQPYGIDNYITVYPHRDTGRYTCLLPSKVHNIIRHQTGSSFIDSVAPLTPAKTNSYSNHVNKPNDDPCVSLPRSGYGEYTSDFAIPSPLMSLLNGQENQTSISTFGNTSLSNSKITHNITGITNSTAISSAYGMTEISKAIKTITKYEYDDLDKMSNIFMSYDEEEHNMETGSCYTEEELDATIRFVVEKHQTHTVDFIDEPDDALQERFDKCFNECKFKEKLFGEMRTIALKDYENVFKITGIDIDGRLFKLTECISHIEGEIQDLVTLCKELPDFKSIHLFNQQALLKGNSLMLLFIGYYKGYDSNKKMLVCKYKSFCSHDLAMWGEKPRKYVDILFGVADELKSWSMSYAMHVCLKMIILFDPDHVNNGEKNIVERLRTKYKACLKLLFRRDDPGLDSHCLDEKIDRMIEMFRNTSAYHNQMIKETDILSYKPITEKKIYVELLTNI